MRGSQRWLGPPKPSYSFAIGAEVRIQADFRRASARVLVSRPRTEFDPLLSSAMTSACRYSPRQQGHFQVRSPKRPWIARAKLKFVDGNYGSMSRYKHSVDRSAQVIEDASMRWALPKDLMYDADGNYGSCSNAVHVGRNKRFELRSSIDGCRFSTSNRTDCAA